jgi:hypothetical protein
VDEREEENLDVPYWPVNLPDAMMEGVIASPITAENAKSAVNKTPKDDAKGGLPLATPSDSSKSRAKVTPDGPLFTFDAKGD